MSEEFKFKAEDFMSTFPTAIGIMPSEAADIANSIIDAYVRGLPVVYETADGWQEFALGEMGPEDIEYMNKEYPRARLWKIKTIEKN